MSFRENPVILAFYPADWSRVCSDQMVLYYELLSEFRKYKAELLGVSLDGYLCHGAFAKNSHLHFPLLSEMAWVTMGPLKFEDLVRAIQSVHVK